MLTSSKYLCQEPTPLLGDHLLVSKVEHLLLRHNIHQDISLFLVFARSLVARPFSSTEHCSFLYYINHSFEILRKMYVQIETIFFVDNKCN